MRLILVDSPEEVRGNFYPLALSRPLWELRCGFTSLGEKLIAKVGVSPHRFACPAASCEANRGASRNEAVGAAYFVADYMADAYRAKVKRPVNDPSVLDGDDLLIVDPRVKADSFDVAAKGPSEVGLDEQGSVLYARVAKDDVAKLHKTQDTGRKTQDTGRRTQDTGRKTQDTGRKTQDTGRKTQDRDEGRGTRVESRVSRIEYQESRIAEFIAAAKAKLPNVRSALPTWRYIWDLVLANAEQITADFAAAGRNGIEGMVEQPSAIRGNKKDIYIAPGVTVHPMVVIDTEDGPVYIDEDAEIHPFSRIEGPCYIGKKSVLLGAKCREGNSIGPLCRIGGEVEESIIQGHSNKYHDGFIGHAYVGEWVNLGALTTNSDLKNDYSTVSVMLDGRRTIDTGSTKVGSLIGDHAKTSIGTLLNTGSYVGAMALIMATGKPLPKFIPSFAWFVEGIVTKGFGKGKLYETAEMAMSRRNCQWSEVEQSMWDAVFKMTAPVRNEAIKKGRRAMLTR